MHSENIADYIGLDVHKETQYSKDIAWKAQQRLCSRYRSLTAK